MGSVVSALAAPIVPWWVRPAADTAKDIAASPDPVGAIRGTITKLGKNPLLNPTATLPSVGSYVADNPVGAAVGSAVGGVGGAIAGAVAQDKGPGVVDAVKNNAGAIAGGVLGGAAGGGFIPAAAAGAAAGDAVQKDIQNAENNLAAAPDGPAAPGGGAGADPSVDPADATLTEAQRLRRLRRLRAGLVSTILTPQATPGAGPAASVAAPGLYGGGPKTALGQ